MVSGASVAGAVRWMSSAVVANALSLGQSVLSASPRIRAMSCRCSGALAPQCHGSQRTSCLCAA
eukprot:3761581-Alexandrium_andersonii.AAC.1